MIEIILKIIAVSAITYAAAQPLINKYGKPKKENWRGIAMTFAVVTLINFILNVLIGTISLR